jgi:glucokinase
MRLLAGDIGGTKTTLALFTPKGVQAPGVQVPGVQNSFRSNEYPGREAVAAEFLGETGLSIDRAVFGVAGPVAGGQATATNLPFYITEEDLGEALRVQEVKLLNDLEATAYGVPNLLPGDRQT